VVYFLIHIINQRQLDVAQVLFDSATKLISGPIGSSSLMYVGYITTSEEYETQQYESGHTVHGKWTLPAYLQTLTGLAESLNDSSIILTEPEYDDWRGKAKEVIT
jgi:hypothetical protein